jgi:hypothetical protein
MPKTQMRHLDSSLEPNKELHDKAWADWLVTKRRYFFGQDTKDKWLQDHEEQGHSVPVPEALLSEKIGHNAHPSLDVKNVWEWTWDVAPFRAHAFDVASGTQCSVVEIFTVILMQLTVTLLQSLQFAELSLCQNHGEEITIWQRLQRKKNSHYHVHPNDILCTKKLKGHQAND